MIYIDDLKRLVEVPNSPQRIISLVPSLTELLFDLGLEKLLVGRTKFCIYPKEKVEQLPSVGGPKDFDLDKIRALKPSLILAVKEENNKELILEIALEFPLIIFDVVDISSALRMIKEIGDLTNTKTQALKIINAIQEKIIFLQKKKWIKEKACYLIWNKPIMTINGQTFISEMMRLAGFENVFSQKENNYPTLEKEELKAKNPQYILLSSEPFLFTHKHQQDYQKQYPKSKVLLVDGEMFSWYGSRMLKAFDYFISEFN
jgi:ABC-type Fe3+-hydroxamate transport system substrate-binding protein